MSVDTGTGMVAAKSGVAARARVARLSGWRPSSRGLLGLFVTLVVVYLVVGPIVLMAAAVFQNTDAGLPLSAGAVWTLDNLVTVFTSARAYELLLSTLVFALGSLAFGGVIALALAWLTERTNLPLPRTIFVLIVASAGVPSIIATLAWATLLHPRGSPVNDLLNWMFGWTFNSWSLAGMVFVQGISLVPIMYLLISATFKNMNPALEEAARASGASTWVTIRKVTLPLLTPAIAGAFIYAFVSAASDVDVALVFGLPGGVRVLSTHVYLTAEGATGLPQYGLASTYGLLILGLSALPLWVYNRMIAKNSSRYATVSGKGFRPGKLSLGAWRWPVFAVVFGYLFLQLVVPMLMLFWSSIQPFYDGFTQEALDRITFSAWTTQLGESSFHRILWTTIKVAFLSALGTVAVTMLGSWVVVRSRNRFAGWIDFLMFFPHMMSGIVIALAVLLLYLVLPLPVYGTVWLLVAGFIVKSLPLASRITTPGIGQVSVTLEEAVAASGGKLRHTWRRVLIPLLKGVTANSYILVFMATLQNLSLPLLLGSPGNEMIAPRMLYMWESGEVRNVAVISLFMMGLTTVLAATMRGGTDRTAR